MRYRILDWDSEFFGIKVAQIIRPHIDTQELSNIVSELKSKQVRLTYWSSEKKCEDTVIKRLNGNLVDKRTTFVIDFRSLDLDKLPPTNMVEVYSDFMSIADLESLAIQSGTYSRFAIDSNIPKQKFVDMYKIWINRSLRKEIATEVLVIRDFEKIAGMVVLNEKSGKGNISLTAVDCNYRGRKYGEKLIRAAQTWFVSHKFNYGQIVTQGQNIPACNLYKKCGYEIGQVEYFYHFWL